ncbi:MAG: hypothetical protein D6696_18825, partial [Acidobacteria bacterium]
RLPHPRPADALLAAAAGGIVLGLGVARLTLAINPHLAARAADVALLHLELAVLYAVLALVPGLAGAAILALGRHAEAAPALRRGAGAALLAALATAPVVYLLLLPDAGLAPRALTWLIFAPPARRALALAAAAAGLLVLGLPLALGVARLARACRTTTRRSLAAVTLTLLAGAVLSALLRPPAEGRAKPPPPAELGSAPSPPPAPVVLLCIDGADLDDVILPLVEDGELPAFARLMRQGTWGSLATLEPTLSPVVWTTLITGKPPAEHGIRHFLFFRLPGIRQAIYAFPLHTGLNFRLFPLLEKLPFMPVLRTPFTSNLRRSAALWTIAGQRHPVGVYRWLLSWPAERVNGFYVAGAIGWVRFSDGARRAARGRLRGAATYPPELLQALPPAPRHAPTDAELRAYVGDRRPIDRHDPLLRPILHAFADPTSHELPLLIERFAPRFVAASFYPVDAFHHFYHAHRRRGGRFAGAIAERYRTTDARLGELLEVLGDDRNLIVTSDHGFDFDQGHHAHAPPGIFFARGPAFDAGRRVDGLSVYDVAPMVLHLLDMPLPDDMPGARSGRYRRALSDAFLSTHPVSRIASYEGLATADYEALESPEDERIRRALESLGYVQ